MPQIIESKCLAINLRGGCPIPDGRILFVGTGLQARARFEGPESLKGRLDAAPAERLPDDLGAYEVAVLDLDEVGIEPAASLRERGFGGRILGFYSHVDETLGADASAAGIETYRRGRFWRELSEILG